MLKAQISLLKNKNKQLEKQNYTQMQKLSEKDLQLCDMENRLKMKIQKTENYNKFEKIIGKNDTQKDANILKLVDQFIKEDNYEGLIFLNNNFYYDVINYNFMEQTTSNLDIISIFMSQEQVFNAHIMEFITDLENTQKRSVKTGLYEYDHKKAMRFIVILNNISLSVLKSYMFSEENKKEKEKFKNTTTKLIDTDTDTLKIFLHKLTSDETTIATTFLSLETFIKIQKKNPKDVVVQNIVKNKNKKYLTPQNIHLFTTEQQKQL